MFDGDLDKYTHGTQGKSYAVQCDDDYSQWMFIIYNKDGERIYTSPDDIADEFDACAAAERYIDKLEGNMINKQITDAIEGIELILTSITQQLYNIRKQLVPISS
jgi:hypothetical protein